MVFDENTVKSTNMNDILNEKLSISRSSPIMARHYDYDQFTYPLHFHSQYEIIFIKEGTGKCITGDAIENFSSGDLYLMGSNLPHCMRSDAIYEEGNKNLRVKGTIIQLEENFMSHAITYYPQFSQIKKLLGKSALGIHFPYTTSQNIIKRVTQLPNQKGIKQILQILQILQDMAVCKGKRYLASPDYHEQMSYDNNSRLERVTSYLSTNYTRNITLTEIASIASMNTTAFCRFFKENTSKTFMQYIAEKRIEYACRLLSLEENLSIYKISIECGFESITQFHRMFKRYMCITPTQYREQVLTAV